MKDIQNQPDNRCISIKKVGVKNISYPITVLDKAKRQQKTVATVNMYVNLPAHFKGTHMSRFIEILNHFRGEINLRGFHVILAEMKRRLQAEAAHMEIEFPYFLRKKKAHAVVDPGRYLCRMHGSLEEHPDLTMAVKVPVSISLPERHSGVLPRLPGHWGAADICVRFRHFMWIEDLIDQVEEVTDNRQATIIEPPSAEALTRNLGEKLRACTDISWFSVRVENFAEDFSTFALLEWPETATEPAPPPIFFAAAAGGPSGTCTH